MRVVPISRNEIRDRGRCTTHRLKITGSIGFPKSAFRGCEPVIFSAYMLVRQHARYKGPKIFFACGALRIPRPNFYLFGAKSIRESFSSAWFGVSSRYRGPKIFFACGALRIPLEISKEAVVSVQCFSFGPGAVVGGAYMLVRHHACSSGGVERRFQSTEESSRDVGDPSRTKSWMVQLVAKSDPKWTENESKSFQLFKNNLLERAHSRVKR